MPNGRYLPQHVPHGIGLYSQGLGRGYAAIADALKVMQGLKFDYLTNKAKLEALQREKAEQREYTEAQAEQTLQTKLGYQIAQRGGRPELGDTQAMFEQLAGLARQQPAATQVLAPGAKFMERDPATGGWSQVGEGLPKPESAGLPLGSLPSQFTPSSIEQYLETIEKGDPKESVLQRRPPAPTPRPAPKPPKPPTLSVSEADRVTASIVGSAKVGKRPATPVNPAFAQIVDKIGKTVKQKGRVLGVFRNIDWAKRDRKELANEVLDRMIYSDFPEGEEWSALGTADQIRRKYPGTVKKVMMLRQSVPGKFNQTDNAIITTPDRLNWRRNLDGTYTQVD